MRGVDRPQKARLLNYMVLPEVKFAKRSAMRSYGWEDIHRVLPVVQRSGARLKGWLEEHPKALGSMVLERWGAQLPFLFKVLSVDTALSIQSHPDKELAEKLHAERPQVYKDANHKPEMAVALEDFEALCGFAPLEEICAEVAVHPEVQACLGAEATQALLATPRASAPEAKLRLKQAFTALMTCDASIVSSAVTQLAARLSSSSQPLSDKQLLVLRLNKQYPQDVGVLSVFFFNYMRLPKGSGLSLPANEPHAYLSGEIVECMATSDNVIRAGLTPKLRDTSVLCESLSYECRRPTVLEGRQTTAVTRTYRPPFEEFELHNLQIAPSAVSLLRAGAGPALMLQLGGDAQGQVLESKLDTCTDLERDAALKRGDVVLVPAGTTVALQAGDSGACLWVATCNSSSFAAECAPATTVASSAATTPAGTPAAAVGASLVGAA